MLRIHKASAGSGKTFTLARQYLKLLLGYEREGKFKLRSDIFDGHRHILAITFTNKATQEMTRRIIDELAILAALRKPKKGEKSDYLDYFIEEFDTTEKDLKESARKALFSLLFDFAFFHVSTIDAFFQIVLRTFAREVELPDNFDLELDNKFTVNLGVNEMFNSLNYRESDNPEERKHQRWLKSWLQNHLERMLREGKSVNLLSRTSGVHADLIESFTKLLNEDFKLNMKSIMDYLEDKSRLEGFQLALVNELTDKEANLRNLSLSLLDSPDFGDINRFVANCVRSWAEGKIHNPSASVEAAVGDIKKRYYKAKISLHESTPFDRLVIETCSAAIEYYRLRQRNQIILDGVATLGLLGTVVRIINDYCKENNLILLSETNSLLRGIINVDDTPFIYENIGYYLHHFLIDEFQDTSRMQWENLAPLLHESLAVDRDNLIIGDEKQCIYRFRNSDPELLGNVVERQIAKRHSSSAVEIKGRKAEENTNWRSSVEVVKFNNTFFRALARQVDASCGINTMTSADGTASEVYGGVVQSIPDKHRDFHGFVKMYFLSDEEKQQIPSDDDADETNSESRNKALQILTENINRQLSSGYRPKDIAVLIRTHKEGEIVINHLLGEFKKPDAPHRDVQIVSTDSMDIGSSPSVKLIIEILRLAVTPSTVNIEKSDGTVVTATNPAWRRTRLMQQYEYFLHLQGEDGMTVYSSDEAFRKAIEATRSIGNGDTDVPEELKIFFEGRAERLSALDGPSLDIMVERIIDKFISKEALRHDNIFLVAFQDLVFDFMQRGNSDIRSFLNWWDTAGKHTGISSGEEVDAINVMTIHQSKGLEFPCVNIPFANWEMVTYNSFYKPSYGWYRLEKEYFNDLENTVEIPPFVPLCNTSKLKDIDVFESQAKLFASKQSIDALNVAYVAFTRAVSELIVICPQARGENNLAYNIQKTLESLESDPALDATDSGEAQWLTSVKLNPEDKTVTVGCPTFKKQTPGEKAENNSDESSDNKDGDRKLSSFELVAQALKEVEACYSPAINEKVMLLTDIEESFFDYSDPQQKGSFLHDVMSKVRVAEDLTVALRRMAYRYRLTDEQQSECLEILNKAIMNKDVRRWFKPGITVLNEREILKSDGTNERPDRVVIFPDGSVEIVDYKFGDYSVYYRGQVRGYMNLYKEAGYSNVKGFIWYPHTGRIDPVYPKKEAAE